MRRAAAISAAVMGVLATLALFANYERQIAREGQKRLRRLLYVADMNVAQQAAGAGNFEGAMGLLEEQQPEPGQEDLRGFEWRYLWQLCKENSRRTLRGHRGRVFCVVFSPNGKTLITGAEDTIKLWDLASGQCRATLPGIPGHADRLQSLALSPNGRILAASSAGSTVNLWDLATRREVATLEESRPRAERPQYEGVAVAFSPDGKTLAAARMNEVNTVTLWDVATGREAATLHGHTDTVRCVAFSPDGNLLASGGDDYTVRLWRAPALRR